jgi:Fe-S cluster biosynthesis and repair protein YggX
VALNSWLSKRFAGPNTKIVVQEGRYMTRMVFCKKFKEELPGLAIPPLPGATGQEIFETVSEKAWKEWQANQTMLINEHRLSLMDADARKFLTEEMHRFFDNQDYAKPKGYVPPSS